MTSTSLPAECVKRCIQFDIRRGFENPQRLGHMFTQIHLNVCGSVVSVVSVWAKFANLDRQSLIPTAHRLFTFTPTIRPLLPLCLSQIALGNMLLGICSAPTPGEVEHSTWSGAVSSVL